MDYSELVKALRYCSTTKGMVYCNVSCKYGWEERSGGCKDLLTTDAADAIEALQKNLKAVQENSGINFRMWEEAQAEVKRLQEKLCDWCAVCPKERRKPEDCEMLSETPVMYGPSCENREVQDADK